MKKLISLCIIFGIVIGMTACQQKEPVDKSGHPLALYEGDQIVAEIGMKKEEVEAVLGQGREVNDGSQVNYTGLILLYRDGVVCSISATDEKYSDNLGVSVRDGFGDAMAAYSEGQAIYGIQLHSIGVGFDSGKQIISDPVEKGYALYLNEEIQFAKEYQRMEAEDGGPAPTAKSTKQKRKTATELMEEENQKQQFEQEYETYITENPEVQMIGKILIRDRKAMEGEF